MNLLTVADLSVRRGTTTVLHGAALSVAPGEVVGLIGPNGAGKTTLLRAALGLIPRAGGTVTLGGDALDALPPPERARRAAWLPQERDIAWPIAVERLVALGRLPHRGGLARASAADRKAVAEAMATMGVAALAGRPATALSGGERARVLIARALAQQAPLLVADEPAAGLDPAHQLGLMEAFRRLAGDRRGVLVSLHDLGLAARWCDRLVLLHRGGIAAAGPPAAVLTAERLHAVYGIRARVSEDSDGLTVRVLGRASG
ncbi:MAG: ABC transporter ATP-binding protein [Alphaproteobacteria bacterium]|nr:ABC transporter ATP-binding protein [Alphaproteobacteria bacterium]